MSDKTKDLIKRLRANGQKNYGLYAEAADALEALLNVTPVCEWTNASGRTVSTCMPNGITKWLWNEKNQEKCINCLKPIKFTDWKE